jgi:hypothetical protein
VAGSNRSGSGNDGRRPTKAERREDARRQREEIQRRMARRRRNRSLGLVLVVVAIAVAIVAVFLTSGGDGGSGAIATGSELLQQAKAAQTSAGCEPVETVGFYDGMTDTSSPDYHDQSHIGVSGSPFPTPPKLSTYPSTPPASGPHDPTPLPGGIYDSPPSVYQAIHSLEHGGVIIWYAPGISSQALDDLKAFYGQAADQTSIGQDRVIIAPYDYSNQGVAGELPAGVQMALVAWHRLQTCTQVSLAAAFDFSSQYGFYQPLLLNRPYKGEAPEAGAAM